MKVSAVILNLIVVLFFSGFLIYTFMARPHLDSLARQYVTERTLEFSRPIFDLAEEGLKLAAVRLLLSQDQESTLQDEIASYRQNPIGYVEDLTGRALPNPPVKQAGNPLSKKVMEIKNGIREYYDGTLRALIIDLRIFAISNLLAGTIALGLASFSQTKIRKSLLAYSLAMFLTVFYCSILYVDDLTFFRILTRSHLGWGYAGLLAVMTLGLYWDHSWRCCAEPNSGPNDQRHENEQVTSH